MPSPSEAFDGQRIPRALLHFGSDDVASQRVPWSAESWGQVLRGHPILAADIEREVDENSGIRRAFVHDRAADNPVELFLTAMAWGFGTTSYGPSRVAKIMADPGVESKLANIVNDVRTRGGADGWKSLLLTNKIPYLGMAYGTKLLYFAGYSSDCPGPRPLVLDQFVRASLVHFGVPRAAKGTLWRDDYVTYLTIAERWAADPAWDVTPEVAEFGLFTEGKRIADRAVDDGDSESVSGEARPE